MTAGLALLSGPEDGGASAELGRYREGTGKVQGRYREGGGASAELTPQADEPGREAGATSEPRPPSEADRFFCECSARALPLCAERATPASALGRLVSLLRALPTATHAAACAMIRDAREAQRAAVQKLPSIADAQTAEQSADVQGRCREGAGKVQGRYREGDAQTAEQSADVCAAVCFLLSALGDALPDRDSLAARCRLALAALRVQQLHLYSSSAPAATLRKLVRRQALAPLPPPHPAPPPCFGESLHVRFRHLLIMEPPSYNVTTFSWARLTQVYS